MKRTSRLAIRGRLARYGALAFVLVGLQACQAEGPEPTTDAEGPGSAGTEQPSILEPKSPGFAALFPESPELEVLAEGFEWSEGPVWLPEQGELLFSDVPENRIHAWSADEGARVWLEPSGYTGSLPRGGEPGSNGLALDGSGRLLLCQHGDRRVARLAAPLDRPEVSFETVASAYDGKAFHSPNDLVVHSSGAVFFTDPPYGLEGGPDGPGRELDFQGVYRIDPDGEVVLISRELSRPNGIALSPDESRLYVASSDPDRALWMLFDLSPEGEASGGRLFYDASEKVGEERPGLPDGMAVDHEGRLFATGPGGIWVFTPEGEHLGTVRVPQPVANCAFGGDGSSLFLTADHQLLRLRTKTLGLGFSGS